jgi:hypothetical protein
MSKSTLIEFKLIRVDEETREKLNNLRKQIALKNKFHISTNLLINILLEDFDLKNHYKINVG